MVFTLAPRHLVSSFFKVFSSAYKHSSEVLDILGPWVEYRLIFILIIVFRNTIHSSRIRLRIQVARLCGLFCCILLIHAYLRTIIMGVCLYYSNSSWLCYKRDTTWRHIPEVPATDTTKLYDSERYRVCTLVQVARQDCAAQGAVVLTRKLDIVSVSKPVQHNWIIIVHWKPACIYGDTVSAASSAMLRDHRRQRKSTRGSYRKYTRPRLNNGTLGTSVPFILLV